MRPIAKEAIGLEYRLAPSRDAARGGSYNLTIAAALACAWALAAQRSLLFSSLAAFVLVSLVVALAVDDEPLAHKVSPRSMPRQLLAYGQLALGVARDCAEYLALTFGSFLLLAPWARGHGLWNSSLLFASYGLLLAVRLTYAVWLLANRRRRWENQLPPFVLRKGNFRSVERATKHIVWSFFLGNVGLAVRCGKQVALLGLFGLISATLPDRIAARFPYGWVLGVVVAGVGVYRSGALLDALYYKIHRTIHGSRPLYAGVHRIHHKAVLPSLLDAGTESPAELVLTEYSAPVHVLFPSWGFFLVELSMFVGHFQGHHTKPLRGGDGQTYLDAHVDHHRLVSFNFSCGSEPDPAETARSLPIVIAAVAAVAAGDDIRRGAPDRGCS